jgi:hemerythrin-like metal-binding protein
MARKILIVEDEKHFHDLYKEMLECKGYDIICAYDGDEAMEKVEQKKPDLIIMDIKLDLVKGDTFFQYLKGIPEYANLPVIIVSAFPQRDYKSLEDIDPKVVYIEKFKLTKEILLEEIEKKLKNKISKVLEWEDKFSVGISMIDDEHKKIIGLLNKAICVKEQNGNPEELREVLREITNYVLTHFKTEESYMKEFNYPEYKDHKEEHRNFSNETITYKDNVIKGDYQIANEIIEYLKWWLVNHIQVTDKKYTDCFKRNGL